MRQKNNFVYRVFKIDEYKNFKKKKIFQGNEMDLKSGFIHLSTKKQLKQTILNYFEKIEDLVIVELKCSELESFLKWEVSTNNAMFPHLYNKLDYKCVNKVLRKRDLIL